MSSVPAGIARRRNFHVLMENIIQAVDTVRSQRMRSALLILGVAIGTSTLLGMVSLLFGLKEKLREDIVAANRPYLNVTKYDVLSAEDFEKAASRPNLTIRDMEKLDERAESLDKLVFTREFAQNTTPPMLFFEKERAEFVYIWGSSPGGPDIFNLPLDEGRFVTDDDIARRRRVIVLGWGPRQELFKNRDPLGKSVRVGTERYRVVGAFGERKHISGKLGENYACIPHTTFEKDFGGDRDEISFQATVRPGYTMDQAVAETHAQMRAIRRLRPGQEDNFAILASETLQKLLDQLTMGVIVVLIVISSIGLMVGGIGVMNILLISVTERTREVGVRMALGARKFDVLLQFLVEAVTLTGFGGLVGAAMGFGLAKALTAKLSFPFFFEVWMVVMAVGFSMFVGLVFGIYPANRAAKMQPIDALRQE